MHVFRGSSSSRMQDANGGVRDPTLSGGPYSSKLPYLATMRGGDTVLGLLQHQYHALPCDQKTPPECQGKEKHVEMLTDSYTHTHIKLH